MSASRGSAMVFERSYVNWDEGMGVCCWNAPSKEKLTELFKKAGTPFSTIVPVEEFAQDAFG
ncbi:MAG: nickel-binding protein [Planctomycetota bacterium]